LSKLLKVYKVLGVVVRNTIEFLFNGERRSLSQFDPNMTVLRYIREVERATGSKEGCAEGDCGACTVVVAELIDEKLNFQSVNSCIQLLGMMDGKALLTIESLKEEQQLHLAQQAMVEEHGSQCGFCTPGFVMSIFAGAQNGVKPTRKAVNELLAGNLCRCTGYTPIINAATRVLQDADAPLKNETLDILCQKLKDLPRSEGVCVQSVDRKFLIPKTPEELSACLARHPEAKLLAGGTDLGVQITKKNDAFETLVYLGQVSALQAIEHLDGGIQIGAAVTYAKARPVLNGTIPSIGELIGRVGAVQVRNLGTIGGNLANGSPIGDMAPAFIAYGAQLKLRGQQGTRVIPLEDFFIEYGRQDISKGEFVESVWLPIPSNDSIFKVYKVSKRVDQDISSVCGAFKITTEENSSGEFLVRQARVCFGGMAGIPMRALDCEAFMTNRVWSEATVREAMERLKVIYQPLNDARASAEYRSQVAANLLYKFFIETQSSRAIGVHEIYA